MFEDDSRKDYENAQDSSNKESMVLMTEPEREEDVIKDGGEPNTDEAESEQGSSNHGKGRKIGKGHLVISVCLY